MLRDSNIHHFIIIFCSWFIKLLCFKKSLMFLNIPFLKILLEHLLIDDSFNYLNDANKVRVVESVEHFNGLNRQKFLPKAVITL